MHLSDLYIYPLKSGAGINLSQSLVESRGLQLDRRWLVVDLDGRFMTARKNPKMVLIRAIPQHNHELMLSADGFDSVLVSGKYDLRQLERVSVWSDECEGIYISREADLWLSNFLGIPCRLVFMPEETERAVDPDYAQQGDIVSFADGYPLLLTTEASLADLNGRLSESIDMIRFRPNVVVQGVDAFAEDSWKRVMIGSVEFECSRPCARCVLTTVDPSTGRKDESGEPLTTLKTYRHEGKGVLFGVNLIPRSSGQLHVGDEVKILA
jgi:uncharacterized protein YcbX